MAGTVIACDAPAAADLVFVSHASAWSTAAGGPLHRPPHRHPRVQILTTTDTLSLMGPRGDRLRARALMPGYGRPFALGFLRLELVPAGHQPGAAALLCDTGKHRLMYASTVCLGVGGGPGFPPGELRRCDALCLDATFADPRFRFLPSEEGDGRLAEFVERARVAGAVPVVLASPRGAAEDVGRALRAAGWRLRADRAIVDAFALHARCGIDVPPVARFAGRLARDEVLLWSATVPGDGHRARPKSWAPLAANIRTAWVSEWACDPMAASRVGADVAIPASRQADFEGLLAYVLASGAHEVATLHSPSDALELALRAHGIDVYAVGPPRQIGLFDRRA